LLLNTFGAWKLAIPRWGGFHRELSVLDLERAAHGGVLAWDLLQPVLGHPLVTILLDRIYFSWLPVFVVVAIWQVVWREPAWERKRFLLALTLVWLGLGVVVATAAASAGPIFLDRVLPGSGHYQDMFAYLTGVTQPMGLITLEVRDLLWTTYQDRLARPFQGISAFPSIHVAVAFLYVLALWRSHPKGRWWAAVYAGAIALSSVHLGWHYAIDAYAAVIGAAGCWFLAGFWTRPSS
jgi:membrane-associated phospholipid phosphatase